MNSFWYYIYNLFFLQLFRILVYCLQPFDKKIREGINGRKRLYEDLIINLAGLDRKKK